MTTNNTFKGVDVRQTGNQLVFRAGLLDSSQAIVTSGTTTLRLAELQSDGTFKTYDFTSNTFKTSGMSNGGQTAAMTHRTWLDYSAGDTTINTGIWTYSLGTLSGFTVGAVYIALVTNTGASPNVQWREFQYGGDQGDLVVLSTGTGAAVIESDCEYWHGSAVAAPNVAGYPLVDIAKALGTTLATPTTAGIPKVEVSGWGGANVGAVPPDAAFIRSGTAQAGAATSITLDSGASASDGFYQDRLIWIRSGTGAGQSRHISSYAGSTKVATVRRPWVTNPDNTSLFTIHVDGMPSDAQRGVAAAAASTTLTLAAALGADNLPNGAKLRITGGTGAGQTRVIVGYVNSTKIATVDRAWIVTPDTTSVYEIVYDDAPALNSSLQVASSSDTSYSCGFEAALTDSAGDAVRIEAWLKDQGGKQVDQTAGATCTITFRELGSHVDLLSLTPALDTTNHRFYVEQATPSFATDRGYVILVTITDASSNVYGPTIHSTSVFG